MYINKPKWSPKEMQHVAKIKKRNRHQRNTDDGGQTMGEEMRHHTSVNDICPDRHMFFTSYRDPVYIKITIVKKNIFWP